MMEMIKPFLTLVLGKKRIQEEELTKLFQDTKQWKDYEKEILKEDD